MSLPIDAMQNFTEVYGIPEQIVAARVLAGITACPHDFGELSVRERDLVAHAAAAAAFFVHVRAHRTRLCLVGLLVTDDLDASPGAEEFVAGGEVAVLSAGYHGPCPSEN